MPDFINVDDNGKYIKASYFNPYAKKIRETICPNEIGVEEFSFYTFRKTHISEMATKLTELVLIQHTGHSRVDTIRKYYAARTDEMDKRISIAVRQVSDQFMWSMSVSSALPREFNTRYKPSKENPLYVKPKIEIPKTRIPKELVPIDKIMEMCYDEYPPDEDFLLVPDELPMLIDCATLSPITTDHHLIPKKLSDDNFIITLKCFDDYPDNLEDHIIEHLKTISYMRVLKMIQGTL